MGYNSKFDDIFMAYYHKLYYHAYSFLHDPDNARDIVNDAFETLWKNFSHHLDSCSTGPYLYSVVRNKCIDTLRRKTIHERFMLEGEPQSSFREDYDYTDYDARLELVKMRIEALPPRSRDIFLLCHIEGYSDQETAERFGISVNTVKTLLSRVMKTLRGESLTHE